MTHKHYRTLRGQRLGFNPSAESHDLLFGRPISYYYKSKDKIGRWRTGWDGRQAATAIFPSLAVTSKTVNFTSAALQFIPIPKNVFELISFFPNFTLSVLHFLSSLPQIPAQLCSFAPSLKNYTLLSSSFHKIYTHLQLFYLSLSKFLYISKAAVSASYLQMLAPSPTHIHPLPSLHEILFSSLNFFHLLQPSSSHPSKL